MNDFLLSPQGPQTVLYACSEQAKAWVMQNLPGEGVQATYLGLFVATRNVDTLVAAIESAGMQVVPVCH